MGRKISYKINIKKMKKWQKNYTKIDMCTFYVKSCLTVKIKLILMTYNIYIYILTIVSGTILNKYI